MTAYATRRSDVITITKTPRAGVGVAFAHTHCNPDGSPCAVVTSVSRSGPLTGMLQAGDRILSCNGCAMVAQSLSETVVALSNLTLVVAPPLEKTSSSQPAARRPALGAVNR
jgi:hypothetical protein